jgi:Signal transduction histidine kinase regulating citrate/malate metabolism
MFFEIFGKLRYKGWINIIQLIILECSVFIAARGLSDLFILKQIVMASVFAILMFWHIKISIKKSFVLALLHQAMILSIDYLTYFISIELCLVNETVRKQYSLENVLLILLGKAIVFLCILIIGRKLREKPTEILVDVDWLKLLIFPIFTIIIIAAMISAFRNVETPEQIMLLLISSFGMIGMNIVVFYLINDIVDRETQLYEDRIFRLQAKNQAQMYRSISENFDKQKKKTHEYKNQISCIEALVKKNQISKLEEYVKGIYSRLDKELDAIDTNNIIVNAILNTKYQEAGENGIVFVLRINDLSGLRLEDEDIVTILSNLLDNAIEACKKCDISRRILKLKFVIEDGMVKIGVRNTFDSPVLYENGEIKSTRLVSAEEHGVGIKNIIEVIEKYDGSYVIKDDGQEFFFSIMIPE